MADAYLVSLLFKIELRKTYQTLSSIPTFIRWALSGLIVFTAARGSLINRALSIQDADFSDDPLLNQLPLNAPWNMDM